MLIILDILIFKRIITIYPLTVLVILLLFFQLIVWKFEYYTITGIIITLHTQ